MANFDTFAPFILKWEGGFVNDPADRGGATCKGITLRTYTDYCRKRGLPAPSVDDLLHIPDAHWRNIAKEMYWDVCKADDITSQSVAEAIVDWVWHSGKSQIRAIQSIVGVAPDGVVGAKTLASINIRQPRLLALAIIQARRDYLKRIANGNNRKFLAGWLNRLDDLQKRINARRDE